MVLSIFPIINNLNSAEATSVASSTTLNMILGYASANLDLVVRDSSGTFASSTDSQMAKFGVTTNNYTGYTLTIAGSDNTGELTNSASSSTLSSITSAIDANTFDSSTSLNGKWGYKPSKYSSADNNSYRPAPTTSASTLDVTDSANASSANNYTIGLGARVDYTKPTGTYTNTFTLTVVANPTPYTISFSDNTSDSSVGNMPTSPITGDSNSTTITLPVATPTRTGYTFSGWCESAPTINADGSTTCSTATIPASTPTVPSEYDFINQTTSTNNVNLYTTWTINTYDLTVEFSGGGVSNVKVCKTAGNCTGSNLVGTITTSGGSVSDLPFNTAYYLYPTFISIFELAYWTNIGEYGTLSCVASDTCTTATNPSFIIKAGNGAVRLTTKTSSITLQNLPDSACTTTPISVVDSRDAQSYTVQRLADGNCWMMDNLNLGDNTNYPLLTDLTADNTNLSTIITAATFNSWKKTSGSQTYTAGEYISLIGTDTTANAPYGTLYNYCAASAGTICNDTNSSNATYDICPKGWRLPTGGSGGEFANLYTQPAYNTYAKMRASIANSGAAFTIPGYFADSSPTNQGSLGYYWSSSLNNNIEMYRLRLDTSSILQANSGNRRSGGSIRCIKTTYMQDVTASMASDMANGTKLTLTDERDNQQYTAAKIGGTLWMTRNLAIGCSGNGMNYGTTIVSKNLTPLDSNIPSNYSTPTASLAKADNTTGCTTSDSSDCESYTTARMKCDTTHGAYYNYAATSAGTIIGDNNLQVTVYSVCPKGWRLPNSSEIDNILAAIANTPSQFNASIAGYYANGGKANVSSSDWWSDVDNGGSQYRKTLSYNGTILRISGRVRTYAFNIRCVRAS